MKEELFFSFIPSAKVTFFDITLQNSDAMINVDEVIKICWQLSQPKISFPGNSNLEVSRLTAASQEDFLGNKAPLFFLRVPTIAI